MEYQIYVGTEIKISKGFMKGHIRFMYCGMSSEHIFVLSPLLASGYQGFSPNIYYSTSSTIIQIFNKDFEVIEVTPEYIILAE